MKLPKMIIFDYGGTLLYEPDFDWLRGEKEVFKHVIENPMNKTPEDIYNFNEKIFGDSQVARDAGFELHHRQMLQMKYEFFNIKLDISYEEAEWILWDTLSPATSKCQMPNVVKMLEYLKSKGIRSGVISNMGWTGAALTKRINTILPDNQFEFIIASSEYCYRKPNEFIFQLALNKAGLKPEEVWFCGDTFSADINGANKMGIYPVYYQGEVEGGPKRKPLTQTVDFEFLQLSDWNQLIEKLEKL